MKRRRRPPALSPHAAVPSKANTRNYRSQQKLIWQRKGGGGGGGRGSKRAKLKKEKKKKKERQGLRIYFLPAQPSSVFPRVRLLSLGSSSSSSPPPAARSLAPTHILAVDRDKTKGSPRVRTITFCITSGRVQLSKQYGPGVLGAASPAHRRGPAAGPGSGGGGGD